MRRIYPAECRVQIISVLASHTAGIAFVRPRAEYVTKASFGIEDIYNGVNFRRRVIRRVLRELLDEGLVETTQLTRNSAQESTLQIRYTLNRRRIDEILPFLQYAEPLKKQVRAD